MLIFSDDIKAKLIANAHATNEAELKGQRAPDHLPVVKIFIPGSAATWLITEMDTEQTDYVYGLADLGQGEPELGWISLREISQPIRLRITINNSPRLMEARAEVDLTFKPTQSLAGYSAQARRERRIIT